jgi:hypothetical protein
VVFSPSVAAVTDIEAFKRQHSLRDSMSQATKIVIGTVGVAAFLAIALLAVIAFG